MPAAEKITALAGRPQDGSKFSFPDLIDIRKQPGAFSDIFAYAPGLAGLSSNGNPSEFAYSAVTGNYFSALGVKPLLGRFFLPNEGEEPGDQLLVVLGYSFWKRRFSQDQDVVGRQVLINGKPAIVIGVAPKYFHGTLFGFDMDSYLPLSILAQEANLSGLWTNRADRELFVFGRLKTGFTMGEAQTGAAVIAKRLASEYPSTDSGFNIQVIPERLARPAPFVSSFVLSLLGCFWLWRLSSLCLRA